MVARRVRCRRLGVRPGRSPANPQAGGRGGRRRVRRGAVFAPGGRILAPRVGGRLRLQRRRHDRRVPQLTRESDLSRLRNHPGERRLPRRHRRDRPPPPPGAGDRDSEWRTERGAQRRAGRGERRDRRLHGRRRAGRSRLADLPDPAVPHLGRGGIGRPERGAARRPADGAMHRPRARQSDPRAARRSHRRTCAGLQHGVPPRRAARGRRLQRHLSARRRRRGHVLAAAGARLEDRLRLGGAGVAPPPIDGERLLAAAGRLRRRRNAG